MHIEPFTPAWYKSLTSEQLRLTWSSSIKIGDKQVTADSEREIRDRQIAALGAPSRLDTCRV